MNEYGTKSILGFYIEEKMMNRDELLALSIAAAFEGGREILKVYGAGFDVKYKEDKSPLTEADQRAHKAITKKLEYTGIPILSEEGEDMSYSKRKGWDRFWMVDPLDGTKEFVKRNGEFTVNIALIEDKKATMGVIYVPVTRELYFADQFAYRVRDVDIDNTNTRDLLRQSERLPSAKKKLSYVVVGSRSHMNEETTAFIDEKKKEHKNVECISRGSSLKLCMVADGTADVYPRFAPTMEWDTAAGQAIVNASGAKVLDWESKKELVYNKENLRNPSFIVER